MARSSCCVPSEVVRAMRSLRSGPGQTGRVSTTRPSEVRTSTPVMSVRPVAVAPESRIVLPGRAFQVATRSTAPARVRTNRP